MSQLRTAITAILLTLVAACVLVEEAGYAQAPKPTALVVAYPEMARDAVADGHVYEYH